MKFAVLALGLGLCPSLFAVSYSWNFTTATGNAGTTGNSLMFTDTASGVTVKATAYYIPGTGTSGAGTFQKAALGQYSHGLGVCYPLNGTTAAENCSNPDHQTDNNVLDEYVLFEFSSPVDPSNFVVQSTGGGGGTNNGNPGDLDVSYWLGGTSAAQTLNLTGTTAVSGLTALGFGAINNNCSNSTAPPGNTCPTTDTSSGLGSRTVDITGGVPTGAVNKVLFGARYLDNNDYFKITSLTGVSGGGGTVPEPSSVILLATIGLVLFRVKSKLVVRPQNN